MTDRLFEVEALEERCCRTCRHSTPRHGNPSRNAYPLVCLVHACPVPNACGVGRLRRDYPCVTDHDGGGDYPRGWEPKDGRRDA